MNVNFKLVWFENEDSAYDAHIDEIESIIREFHLIPDVQRYRCDEYSVEIIVFTIFSISFLFSRSASL